MTCIFWYTNTMIKQTLKGDTMKLSALISEVNQEQDLYVKVNELCERLTEVMHKTWKHSIETTSFSYSEGRKYIKIIQTDENQRMVWGFINKTAFKHFKVGDVLKSAGWNTPALNVARGNLLEGYEIPMGTMRLYGPDYLR